MREAIQPALGTEAGRVKHGRGAGGDRTVELDRLAEEAGLTVLRAAAARGARFSVVSEEIGLLDLGAEWPRVLLDPVDGSLNAKQGLPMAAVMTSLLDGPAVADTRVGWVLNLLSGERWHAIRGAGAYRQGAPLRPLRPGGPASIELLGLESSPRNVYLARALIEKAAKLRLFGSMALSLAHTAAGGLEVFCSPIQARVFDTTAGVLMIQEVGGITSDMDGRPLAQLEAGLQSRSTLLCSASRSLHEFALAALQG